VADDEAKTSSALSNRHVLAVEPDSSESIDFQKLYVTQVATFAYVIVV